MALHGVREAAGGIACCGTPKHYGQPDAGVQTDIDLVLEEGFVPMVTDMPIGFAFDTIGLPGAIARGIEKKRARQKWVRGGP